MTLKYILCTKDKEGNEHQLMYFNNQASASKLLQDGYYIKVGEETPNKLRSKKYFKDLTTPQILTTVQHVIVYDSYQDLKRHNLKFNVPLIDTSKNKKIIDEEKQNCCINTQRIEPVRVTKDSIRNKLQNIVKSTNNNYKDVRVKDIEFDETQKPVVRRPEAPRVPSDENGENVFLFRYYYLDIYTRPQVSKTFIPFHVDDKEILVINFRKGPRYDYKGFSITIYSHTSEEAEELVNKKLTEIKGIM